MSKYILKRILYMIPVLLGVTLLVFVIMHLAPGNVAQMLLGDNATAEQIKALTHEMGLDRPILVQYLDYMKELLHGSLGTSYTTGESVNDKIMACFPYTLKLTLVAAVFSILLALPLGVLAAVKQNTWVDNVSMVLSLIGVSMPIFWLAVMLIMLFSLKLGWFAGPDEHGVDRQNDPLVHGGDDPPGLYPYGLCQGPAQAHGHYAPCLPQRTSTHDYGHRP